MNLYKIAANEFISNLRFRHILMDEKELIIISSIFIICSSKDLKIEKLLYLNESDVESFIEQEINNIDIKIEIKKFISNSISSYSNDKYPNCVFLFYNTIRFLSEINCNTKKDLFYIYNSILQNIKQKHNNYTNNIYVNKLMKQLLNPFNGCTIYDPLCKYGNLLFDYKITSYQAIGEDFNNFNTFISYINGYLSDVDYNISQKSITSTPLKTITKLPSKNYDRIISVLNLSGVNNYEEVPISYEAQLIKKAIYNLSDNGTAVLLVFDGFLFRKSKDKEFREVIVESGYINSVISLPSNIFSGISASMSILILTHGNKKVKMIDASEKNKVGKYVLFNEESITNIIKLFNNDNDNDNVIVVDKETIRNKNFDLTPSLYLNFNHTFNCNMKSHYESFNKIKIEIEKLDKKIEKIINS